MNKTLLLLFLSAAIFGGCRNDDDPQSIDFDSSYFPLQVGNYWEYVPILQHEHLLSVTVEIPSTASIGDHEYYLMVSKVVSTQDTTIMDSSYYRIDSRGYVYERAAHSIGEANRFRLGATEGENWTIKTPPLQGFIVTTSDISSIYLETVPLENCKSYSFDLPRVIDDEHILILAPGLGVVKKFFSGGFDSRLKKATIEGITYNF